MKCKRLISLATTINKIIQHVERSLIKIVTPRPSVVRSCNIPRIDQYGVLVRIKEQSQSRTLRDYTLKFAFNALYHFVVHYPIVCNY